VELSTLFRVTITIQPVTEGYFIVDSSVVLDQPLPCNDDFKQYESRPEILSFILLPQSPVRLHLFFY
jgi:hypothetical protein